MNATQHPKLTIANLKAFVHDQRRRQAVGTVLLARVHALHERMRVDEYVAPILARYAFVTDKWADVDGTESVRPITSTNDLYLSADEVRMPQFYDECADAHEAHGWKGPRTHCPALCAEHDVSKAERALLVIASEFFDVDFHELYGDSRKKAVALFLSDPK